MNRPNQLDVREKEIMTVPEPIWRQEIGDSPLVAAAIHDGHFVRDEVAQLLEVDEAMRLREEDPHTGGWTALAPSRVVGCRSRFEVDLNRPRDKAVYRTPEDAWGIQVWKRVPSDALLARSLDEYDAFYRAMHELFSALAAKWGKFFVFDIHTYNHRRDGGDGPLADPQENPQVNIGTGTMDRERWAPVVDRLIGELRSYDFPGGRLDVRENVKFRGGNFPRWIHETFPESGCAVAIEMKKFFMDEWTGQADAALVDAVGAALRAAVPGVREELARL